MRSWSFLLVLIALPCAAEEGTASLTGIVKAGSVVLRGAFAELQSAEKILNARTDTNGVFRFSNLAPGDYTLKLHDSGMASLTVQSIHLDDGEQRSLPFLELQLPAISCGDPHAVPNYVRLLPEGNPRSLSGNIQLDQKSSAQKREAAKGAIVTLLCKRDQLSAECGKTKTDTNGDFVFKSLEPGEYIVRVDYKGFYPAIETGHKVGNEIEYVYRPIVLAPIVLAPHRGTRKIFSCE